MKCSVPQRCLIVGIALILGGGCSLSRGNLARNSSESAQTIADELSAGDSAAVQTADAKSSADDAGGPPSQPGVKSSGGARNKLTGWMKKKDPKRESIPLDRTDSVSKRDDDESLAEEDAGWWKQTDAPMTAENSPAKKSKSLAIDATPFDQ